MTFSKKLQNIRDSYERELKELQLKNMNDFFEKELENIKAQMENTVKTRGYYKLCDFYEIPTGQYTKYIIELANLTGLKYESYPSYRIILL